MTKAFTNRRAPDGRQYQLTELICVACALELCKEQHDFSLNQMLRMVYKAALDIAESHHARTGDPSIKWELICSKWHSAICGTIGQRLGLDIIREKERTLPRIGPKVRRIRQKYKLAKFRKYLLEGNDFRHA